MATLEVQPCAMPTGAVWPRYTILCDHGGTSWVVSPGQGNEFVVLLLVKRLRIQTGCDCGDDIIERYATSHAPAAGEG